jgi:hypothetical protein
MILNQEQIASFNRLMSGWVMTNKYIGKAVGSYNDLIVLTEGDTICFNLHHFSAAYQEKFVLNNFELYCTQLFLAIKPQIIVFLKNEGFLAYDFQCVFLLKAMSWSKMENVST